MTSTETESKKNLSPTDTDERILMRTQRRNLKTLAKRIVHVAGPTRRSHLPADWPNRSRRWPAKFIVSSSASALAKNVIQGGLEC